MKRCANYQEVLVEALKLENPAIKTGRWRVACAVFGEDVRERCDLLPYLPDAYLIDPATREVHFFEVEVTSVMTTPKLQAYAVFRDDLSDWGIDFDLFTVNQHGHVNVVDLLPHYGDAIGARAH